MGQKDKNDEKPLMERLSQAYNSLEHVSVLVSEITATASGNDDLTPSERVLFSQLQARGQEIFQTFGTSSPSMSAKMPQGGLLTVDENMPPPAAQTRRKSNKSFDALLMLGIKHAPENGVAASQDMLFQLGRAFDPSTKRPSLIAKLNRWKNPQGLVTWQKPQNIALTDLGKAEVEELEMIAKTNGDLDKIRQVITDTWGFTPKG